MKDRPGKKELICFCAIALAMAALALLLQGHTVLRAVLMAAAVLLPFRWFERRETAVCGHHGGPG